MAVISTSQVLQPGNSGMQTAQVRAWTERTAPAWDEFVRQRSDSAIFQTTAWKRVVEETFRYRPLYFYATRGDQITGIAPVFEISNWVTGKSFISVPLAVYGGLCTVDEDSHDALLAHIAGLAKSSHVDYLELRTRQAPVRDGFHRKQLYVTFTAELLPDVDANLKLLPRDTRYMIRKGEKAGLRIEHGLDRLDDFYKLFAISMRRLGTPVYPRALFDRFAREFASDLDLMVLYAGSEPVCGVFSFLYRDTVLPYYAGASEKAYKTGANNLMYWELMKWAVQNGFRYFDFGRSKKGTGSYTFKKSWNMREEPLAYQVRLVERETVPNFSPLNPKFELATKIWQRLPLWAANSLGPLIVRWFP